MNSKGVTLVELIMYVVLLVIVMALIAAPVRKMLSKNITERKQTTMQSSSRDVMTVLSREIRNTGFKRYILTAGSAYNSGIIPNTFVSADSSSFILKQGKPSDTLIIYKAAISASGQCTGTADTVQYYLGADSTLKRKLNSVTISLATDVNALQFMLGLQSADDVIYNVDNFNVNQWTKTGPAALALDGNDLAVSYSGAGIANVALSTSNTFAISSPARVKLTYSLTNTSNVTTNIRTLKWSILDNAGTVMAIDSIKPGLTTGSVVLPVKVRVPSARVQLSADCTGAAALVIKSINIKAIDLGTIVWSDTVTVEKKKHVKSIKIFVLQRSTSKTDSYTGGDIKIANETFVRSGSYAWKLLSETVEVPNNGLF